jgi:hypothetical protein
VGGCRLTAGAIVVVRMLHATRRSQATLFLDTRGAALGAYGSPGFERAVSVTATVGRALSRAGFALRLGMVDVRPVPVSEELLLETLAAAVPSRSKALIPSLTSLRGSSPADTTLAVVTAPPPAAELAAMTRVGTSFGRKLAVLVYPAPFASLAVEVAAELEGRASAARASLQRAGWSVYLVHPEGKLAEVWQQTRTKKLQVAGTLS